MIMVITFVAFLVTLYSAQFMSEDKSVQRFFAYINLFVSSMLILVLADNLLLLFAGFEGVGVCSYLLIGFWYEEKTPNDSAIKAFIMTRIGDVFLLLGLAFIFIELKTLTIQKILSALTNVDSSTLIIISLLLLVGALGKSAQIPLHTWLPDAMSGPTPASALIHAATMVSAGVYLLARMHPLFALSIPIQELVVIIGVITLLLGSFLALRQSDLKRILAYSTISQIGFMFLALGAGSQHAAIFHFTTHAFFKSLLFLGAGVIGEAMHHDYNIFNMGGLRKNLPLVFITFLIGSCALVGLPFVSAGFYSKELILNTTYLSAHAGLIPWIFALCGAFLTALYTGRMLILVFFGSKNSTNTFKLRLPITIPLIILACLSLSAGFLEKPLLSLLGAKDLEVETLPFIIASLVPLLGLALSWPLFKNAKAPSGAILTFDKIYNFVFVKSYIYISKRLKEDFFNYIYNFIGIFLYKLYRLLLLTQTGRIEHYVTIIVASALMILGFLVMS
jgi:NADH-quinone oxidoreductase subunit L